MNATVRRVLWGVVIYEVVAYAWNSYRVSQPSAAGAAVTGLLPFDFLSNVFGYSTAVNPTVAGYLWQQAR